MGPKPKKKGPKAPTKGKPATVAKEIMPLRKSPRLARSEVTDQNDPPLATTLSAYSGSTDIIPPTPYDNNTAVPHVPNNDGPPLLVRQDNLGDYQTSPVALQSESPRNNSGSYHSDMESLTARVRQLETEACIRQLETETRIRPGEIRPAREETSGHRVAIPTNSRTPREAGGPRTTTRPNRRRELSPSSSSEDDDDDNEDDYDDQDPPALSRAAEKFVYTKPPKTAKMIPPFTGEKELWVVWLSRFEAITAQWTHNEKLSAMLALLQGTAGEYAFDILPARVRKNYNLLVKELTSRFKKIISLTSYRNKYSKIKQKSTQSLEELAAVIRKTYEKAWPGREPQTKREDLLRKFLDSLYDPKTRLALEFFKEPESIEEALEKAIAYEDAKGENPPRSKVRRMEVDEMPSEDILEALLADEPDSGNKEPKNPKNKATDTGGTSETLKKLETQMNTLLKQKDDKPTRRRPPNLRRIRQGYIRQTRVPPPRTGTTEMICWNCSRTGHVSRYCMQNPRQCNTCQRYGHMAQFCPSTNGTQRRSQNPFSANQPGGFQNRPQNNFPGNRPQHNGTNGHPPPPPQVTGTGGQAATRETTN